MAIDYFPGILRRGDPCVIHVEAIRAKLPRAPSKPSLVEAVEAP